MGTKTFLEITNFVLRDANEVPLTEASFGSSRGLQTFAKEAVNRSLMDIANESLQWSWLKDSTADGLKTQVTVDGTQWYNFQLPAGDPFAHVDINTITSTDADGVVCRLLPVTYLEWDNLYREADATDTGEPQRVIITDEPDTFGISPVPDDVYTISFTAWKSAASLTDALDTIPFPDQFFNVLVARARYYLWDFKDDQVKASRADKEYRYGVNRMKERQAPQELTRVRFV